MIDFDQVIVRIKLCLLENTNKKKVLDRELADALHLKPSYYAVIKKRKKIPFEAIAYFSKQHHINMNWILLAQTPKHLQQEE